MRWVALFLLTFLSQDPADKIKALVEKLGSDEIADREKAVAELVKLGPAALPAMRDHLSKAEGERKSLLQGVVTKIEREIRLAKLLENPPTVTLKVADKPVEEVLAEMARQTGLKIEGFLLDSTIRSTATFDRVPLWKAVDDLCRAHGGLVPHYSSSRLIVEPGERDGSPLILHRGIGLQVLSIARLAGGTLEIQAVLAHTPGIPLWSTRIEYKELTDDKGKSLTGTEAAPEFSLGSQFAGPTPARNFASVQFHQTKASATEGALRLARVRGTASIHLALDLKPLVVIPDPIKDGESTASGNGFTVTIKKAVRKGSDVTLTVADPDLPESEQETDFTETSRWAFAIRDKAGELYLGRVKDNWGDSDDALKVEITVPAGREIVSFELLEPEKLTEVVIPFDFKDLPIKTR
jgi:hypothetical protein